MEFDSHLGKKLLLPGLLHKLDTKNPTERGLLNLPKGEMIFPGSWFMKESARHSAGHSR